MAAENFEPALDFVLGFEGGFVDHTKDPGGPTNLGITQATLARARGRAVSRQDVARLTRAEAGSIYRRLFWAVIAGDRLPSGLDLAVFDCAVNSGPGRAARLLQRVLGLPQDGIIGPRTLAAASRAVVPDVIVASTGARRDFLQGLATWSVFGRGWSRRIEAVQRTALSLAATAPAARAADPSPTTTKGATMTTASILTSRSVWANLIGLASIGLGLAGVQTGSIDAAGLADAAASLVAAGSFILSTIFRVAEARKATG